MRKDRILTVIAIAFFILVIVAFLKYFDYSLERLFDNALDELSDPYFR